MLANKKNNVLYSYNIIIISLTGRYIVYKSDKNVITVTINNVFFFSKIRKLQQVYNIFCKTHFTLLNIYFTNKLKCVELSSYDSQPQSPVK